MGKTKSSNNNVLYISLQSLEKFLNENNVSLDNLSKEEQDAFMSNLKKSLIRLKKERTPQSFKDVQKIAEEANISDVVLEKMLDSFIPKQVVSVQDWIAMKDEFEGLGKEIEELRKQIEELKGSQFQDINEGGQKKDENSFVQQIKDIKNIHDDKRKKENGKTDKKNELNETSNSDEKTIIQGIEDITAHSIDLLKKNRALGMNGNTLHDALSVLGVGTGTVVAVTGYTIGRLTFKLAKGASKWTKKKFTAPKGTAKSAKEKANKKKKAKEKQTDRNDEKVIENNEKNLKKEQQKNDVTKKKANLRDIEILKEAENAVNEIQKLSEKRVAVNEVDISSLSENKAKILNNIRNSENRIEIEEMLESENSELLVDLKTCFKKLALKSLQNKLDLSYEKIDSLISNLGIDENDELMIGKSSPITLEEIEKKGADEQLELVKKNVYFNLPYISSEELKILAEHLSIKDGNISFYLENATSGDELGISDKCFELARTMSMDEFSCNELNESEIDMKKISDEIETNNQILEEAYSRDLKDVSDELKEQIQTFVTEYNNIIEKNEKITDKIRKRKIVDKARIKVEKLRRYGIIDVISKEDEKTVKLLDEAEIALSQELTNALEDVVDKDNIEMYNVETEEEQEQGQG